MRSAATALLVMGCLALVATSTPRRVGDGVEYWAMTEQLASFRLPAATHTDILRLERDARRIGHGYETSPLRFDHLVAADGRQDFPHFWLYPLVSVPGLWFTRLVGLHPNWAFTLTNLLLLAIAFAIVAREVSGAWAALLLIGPVIWWYDKSHGDVFTLSLLAAGCALWRRAPAWTLVLVALAAAQNPALMPVWAVVAAFALWRTGRGAVGGGIIGACIVAVPLAYYMWRLHVWSPLTGYTQATWPSIRTMASFVIDPNIGLLANVPVVGAALAWVVAIAWRERRLTPIVWRDWLLIAIVWAGLLAGFAQSTNFNHGATPGINRWTLWLTPWLLLLIVPLRASARTVVVLAALNTLWAVWFFRPSLPEVYRYPTRTASWLWTHAPAWYSPAPEIFAERASHREPAILPAAWEGCTKVLAIHGEWPAPCLPPADVPAACFASDALCYADNATPAHIVMLGPSRFQSVLAGRRWSAAQPHVAALRARITAAHLVPRPLAESAVRSTDGVSWASVWTGASTIAIYLDTISPTASLQLRVDTDYHGDLIDLDHDGRVLGVVEVPRSGENPSSVVLPAPASHALLFLSAR